MSVVLQNREASIFIWMALILLFCVVVPSSRRLLNEVFSSLLNWKILSIFLLYIGGLAAITWLLVAVGIWEWNKFPTQVLWLLFTGFPIVLSLDRVKKQPDAYTEYIKGIFEGAALATLLTEAHSFHVGVELILVPIAALMGMCLVISERDESYSQARGCISLILMGIALAMILNSLVWIIYGATWSDRIDQLLGFVAAAVWVLYSLLVLRIVSIVSAYELAFLRASLGNEDVGKNAWKGKLALAMVAKGDVQLLGRFKFYWAKKIFTQNRYRDAIHQAEVFRYSEVEKRNENKRFIQKLRSNTNVAGTDEDGLNLDQREFRETMRLLDRLWLFHNGQYRRHGSFRPEVLRLLDSGLGSDVLPQPFGIEQVISPDGIAWYAYRQTVTGWYFGIGGKARADIIVDRFLFDGPGVPADLKSDCWESLPGEANSRHWSLQE